MRKGSAFLHISSKKTRLLSFLLMLLRWEILNAYYCKECEVTKKVLQYYSPDYDVNEGVGECDDPCPVNKNFSDPAKIAAAQNSLYSCASLLKKSCKEEISSKYRTMDGSCNNIGNPTWGMAKTCYRVLLPHDYSDGISRPRKSCTGSELPNARKISSKLHKRPPNFPDGPSTLVMMEWGQTIAHDITQNNLYDVPDFCVSYCNSQVMTSDKCMAEKIPKNDPTYEGNHGCLPFVRTLPCKSNTGRLEALNDFTGYFDLGLVYGNDRNLSLQLRSNVDGMLKTQEIPRVGSLPPPTEISGPCEALNSKLQCFLSGDFRIQQNPLITTIHIMLLRNHNNICKILKNINRKWDDQKLYEEARRINIAQSQYITFAEFLPLVVGRRLVADFDLQVRPGTQRTNYDPNMDASVLDEVSAAAHRFGHTWITDTIEMTDPVTHGNETLYLKDYFYYPFDYYTGLLEKMTVGMSKKHVMEHSQFYSDAVRDWLYHLRRDNSFQGSDLAATSVIRGRDHAFPGYSYYLKYLFNHDVHSFCDLRKFLPPETIIKMRKLYKSVHDVDMYTAGVCEHNVDGSVIGPTFTSLVLMQYQRIKFGDRYYFEHGGESGSFSLGQLLQIKRTTLSRIICDTTGIRAIQKDVFFPPSERNPIVPCDLIPRMDLSPWAE